VAITGETSAHVIVTAIESAVIVIAALCWVIAALAFSLVVWLRDALTATARWAWAGVRLLLWRR
jgi:hypothetical protein